MIWSIRDLRMKHKLLTIVCCAIIGMVTLIAIAVISLKDSMREERMTKTRNLVEAVYSIVEHYHDAAERGVMTDVQARAAALGAIKALKYAKDDYFWINDMQHRMVMHPKAELIGKDMTSFKDADGKEIFVEFVDTVRSKKGGFCEYQWAKPGENRPSPKISYVMGFDPWQWVIGTGVYADDIRETFWKRLKVLAAISLASIGLILGISWRVSDQVTKPLTEGVLFAKRVAQGDLTCTLPDCATDEIGQLMSAKRDMVTALRTIISDVRSASDNVASASHELSASSEQMSRRVSEQSSISTQIATASEEMSSTVMDIAKNTAQMSNEAAEARTTAQEGEKTVNIAIQEVGAIADSVAMTAGRIQALDVQSRKIGAIVDVINDIADQTNLLALNAAIEAARAGEQGRGFSVVADEVRKLAERSAQATSEITEMIKMTQEEVRLAVSTMADVNKKVERGVELSANAGRALQVIVGNVDSLQGRVQQIASSTEEMSGVAGQISGDIQSIAAGSGELASASGQIAQSAAELSQLSDTMKEAIGHFKTTQGR